jgi:hypothetical protein
MLAFGWVGRLAGKERHGRLFLAGKEKNKRNMFGNTLMGNS